MVATEAAYAHVKINRMPTSIIAILGLKTSQGGNLHEGNVILPFAFPTYPPYSSPPPLIAVIFSKHLVILLNLPHLPLPPKLNFLHDTSFKTSFTEPMGRVKCIADIPIYQTAQV